MATSVAVRLIAEKLRAMGSVAAGLAFFGRELDIVVAPTTDLTHLSGRDAEPQKGPVALWESILAAGRRIWAEPFPLARSRVIVFASSMDGGSTSLPRGVALELCRRGVVVDAISFGGDDELCQLARATGGVFWGGRDSAELLSLVGQRGFLDLNLRDNGLAEVSWPPLEQVSSRLVPNEEFTLAFQSFEGAVPLGKGDIRRRGNSPAESRLRDEMDALLQDPVNSVVVGIGPSISLWYAGFLLENDTFLRAALIFSDRWPGTAPAVYVIDPIHHVNVGVDGYVRMELLEEGWSPDVRVARILRELYALVERPQLNRPANLQALYNYESNGVRAYQADLAKSMESYTRIEAIASLVG
jgi:ubiquitin-protein ligase